MCIAGHFSKKKIIKQVNPLGVPHYKFPVWTTDKLKVILTSEEEKPSGETTNFSIDPKQLEEKDIMIHEVTKA